MHCDGLIGVQYFLVVSLNNFFHNVHALIANFDGVLVKDFVRLLTSEEVFTVKS